MSVFTPKDASSAPLVPGLSDRSPGNPGSIVFKRSRIIRNGTVVWLYSGKHT